jgi:hypothetical protein
MLKGENRMSKLIRWILVLMICLSVYRIGMADPPASQPASGETAKKVLYLCNKSGSMLAIFGSLKQQLKDSVRNLDGSAGQQFNVIFCNDDGVDRLFKDGLHDATPDNLKKAVNFIDTQVSSSPHKFLPAVKLALKDKPELVYFLTDGLGPKNQGDEVVKAFGAGKEKVHVNCIYFESEKDAATEKQLKEITRETGGMLKMFSKSDM